MFKYVFEISDFRYIGKRKMFRLIGFAPTKPKFFIGDEGKRLFVVFLSLSSTNHPDLHYCYLFFSHKSLHGLKDMMDALKLALKLKKQ